ncbi:hypothetical protein LCGC14_1318660, partial [marine sediment metagenome]
MQPPDRIIKEGLEKINETPTTRSILNTVYETDRSILNEIYKIDKDELKRLSKEFEDFK